MNVRRSLGRAVMALLLALGWLGWQPATGQSSATEPGTGGTGIPDVSDDSTGDGSAHSSNGLQRIIVEFRDPPVVRVPGIPRDARGKLILDHVVAVNWRQLLLQQQATFATSLAHLSPSAVIDWTYQLAYNGAAVRIPPADIPALNALRGVRRIWPQRRHEPLMHLGRTVTGAEALWADAAIGGEATAGAGIKVAVVDTGIYIPHEFFDPTGYSYPAGFPKGEVALCTPKVIAARHFFRADDPVDTSQDYDSALDGHSHGTHCAGTIGGVRQPHPTDPGGSPDITGIAPACYLMAYKMLYQSQKGEASVYDGEAVAALEAALSDGADVVSNSWGHPMTFATDTEPQIVTGSNLVHAGLVVVYAAGNSRNAEGEASVGSPAANPDVISVASAGSGNGYALWRLANFSSSGPNLDFTIKPDITAPGVNTMSSIHTGTDSNNDEYAQYSGTSMACPHIAGVCALLKQAHPEWSPADVKSALMTTAGRGTVKEPNNTTPARIMSQGAGSVRAAVAADPGVLADRPSHSFGLMHAGEQAQVTFTLRNITATAESYTVTLNEMRGDANLVLTATPDPLAVPANGSATLTFRVSVGAATPTGEYEGEIVLAGDNGHDAHIVYWLRIVPGQGATPLLLIDYDLDSPADYQSVYTAALTTAGVAHDVWDVGAQGAFPSYDKLMEYESVLLYSGQNTAATHWDKNVASRFLQWLYDGRRIAILGRALPDHIEPRLFGKVFQLRRDGHGDLFAGTPGQVVGQSGSPFDGLTFDLAIAGDNADFLTQVRELPPEFIHIPDLSHAALVASTPTNQSYEAEVALYRNPETPGEFPFRTFFATFGLESINSDTGFDGPDQFISALTSWLASDFPQPPSTSPGGGGCRATTTGGPLPVSVVTLVLLLMLGLVSWRGIRMPR